MISSVGRVERMLVIYNSGTISGWSRDQHSALAHSGAYLDLSSFETAIDLEALGLDRLKSALVALGLKCGGFVDFV